MVLALTSFVRFDQPLWLIVLAAGAVPPLLAATGARRCRRVGTVGVILQSLAIMLAAVALAGPCMTLGRRAARPILVLQDASDSVRGRITPLLLPAGLPRDDQQFAGAISAPGGAVQPGRTLVGPALRLAAARAGELAGAVLVSDGQFQDDWSAAAAELGRSGLPVCVVPMRSPQADARVADISAVRTAAGVELRVTVQSNAWLKRILTVRRESDGAISLPARPMDLEPGLTATIPFIDASAPTDRADVYVAELAGEPDEFPQNDSARTAVPPQRAVVAWIAAGDALRDGLRKSLADAGVELRAVAAESAPADAAGWADFSAVCLVEPVSPSEPGLSNKQASSLAEYVRTGGSLVQIGAGPHASPADRDAPINRVAALLADPYRRKPIKLIVLLDASGSMGEPLTGAAGRVRFDQAIEAVSSLQRHLTKDDSLAVVTFSNVAELCYDSAAGAPDFGSLHEAMRKVHPAGPTKIPPALELAASLNIPTGRQALVLLVSDLLPEPFDVDKAAAMFSARLGLRIVVTTPPGQADAGQRQMRELAGKVGTEPRAAENLSEMSRVFAELLEQARGDPLKRGRFHATGPEERPAAGRHAENTSAPAGRAAGKIFGLLNPDDLPVLHAYYASAPVHRDATDVLLRIGDDPLLARRPVGLGESISLAMPLSENDPAGRNDALDALLSQAVLAVLRRGDPPGVSASAVRENGLIKLTVVVSDPSRLPQDWPVDGLTMSAVATDASGGAWAEVPVRQVGPGRYEASLSAWLDSADGRGSPPAVLSVRDPAGRVLHQSAVTIGAAEEYARIGADDDALNKLAALTGGRIVLPAELANLAARWDAERYSPVRHYVLCLAVAMMLADWTLTRVRRRG